MKYKIELTQEQVVCALAALTTLKELISPDHPQMGTVKSLEATITMQHSWQKSNPTPEATILFPGDSSVGLWPRSYAMELPNPIDDNWSEQDKEELRNKIKAMYEDIDNEERCRVFFEGETD